MAHVKWLTVMVPIHLCLVVQLSCKGKFCCNYKSRAKLSGSAKQHSEWAGPFSLTAFPWAAFRTRNSGRAPTQQHWAQATWSPPLTTAPRTQQGNPWGQGSQGKKGDNNNSPCHVNKVTHFKILPLTPLPPIPQAMFRNGPCLKLNHTTQFKCSSLFWWAGELSYMDMAIAHQMLQGWEWSWACPNRHYSFSTLAVHPRIFQLFPLQEKKGEFFSTLLKWFETLKWKLLYNCKALLIKKTVTFLQYITNKFWFLKGQLTTELLIQIYQLIN